MRVVVFGGSGFLGSYVADELTDQGFDVVVADLYEPVYRRSDQDFVKCDILDEQNIESVINDSVDYVYNFAGLADLNKAIHHPKMSIELNVIGNINILNACIKNNVQRFLYASSAYACSQKGSFYGISKLCSEKVIIEYFERYKLHYNIIRYGSLYGERADSNNWVYSVLRSALQNKKITCIGSGKEIREYIHAKDAAKLSVDLIKSKEQINECVTLTGVEPMMRKDLLKMISEILGDGIEIEYLNNDYQGHYNITPYSFSPITSRKLVNNSFIDLGQGLVNCLNTIHKEIESST